METENLCPNCGNRLETKTLGGLCPTCLMNVSVSVDKVGANQTTKRAAEDQAFESLTPGSQLGPYRIRRLVGHGGMGVVYEAEESESGRRVALKVIQQKLSSSRDRKRFLREGRLAASINHPNCVYVFGTEEINDIPVIAMEFVTGGTLEDRLQGEENQPVAKTIDAVLEVIAGLEAAQAKGILHRDIKPLNCFEDEEGRIKIGDFGLSMSTVARAETLVTESGALVGTPAYCPPEQLRGEDLDARTDMYAVGVMLYQLLTGRLPFEGKSMPQLIANTLEKHALSPRHYRKDIPSGLAKIILRCLEKQPSDRYRNYADLRRALVPYSSTAPTPATLWLRLLAGLLDQLLLSFLSQMVVILCFGSSFVLFDRILENPEGAWLIILPSLAAITMYFALTEWRWGASMGKAICRLRVVQAHGGFPSPGQSLVRAACYVLLPVLPSWIVAIGDPLVLYKPSPLNFLFSGIYHFLIAMLFITARRRNGYAALHDRLTHTRIISRSTTTALASPSVSATTPEPDNMSTRIGPYHVLQPLGTSGDCEWIEGYDLRLLRRVMIRKVPAGSPSWPNPLCHLARIGRLRWLTGRRAPDENWDAFEGIGGKALLDLAQTPQPWNPVRHWLHDLAIELAAAVKDNTTPDTLSLDRVWISAQGRVKLLDVPAPVASETNSALFQANSTLDFLQSVAVVALCGAKKLPQDPNRLPIPLPIHARSFLTKLTTLDSPTAVVDALRPLLRRPAQVTRRRRAVILAACVGLPLIMGLGMTLTFSFIKRMESQHPELAQLTKVLRHWDLENRSWFPSQQRISNEDYGVFIATHFREVIADKSIWMGTYAQSSLSQKSRTFAEASVVQYISITPEQKAQAETVMEPILKDQTNIFEFAHPRYAVMAWTGVLIVYVAVPAIIAALLFRGGLVLRACGVTFVRRDGRPAGRLRLLWRASVAWIPILAAFVLSTVLVEDGSMLLVLRVGTCVCLLAIASLLLPERSLPDRLAGTWPVPR